MRSLTLLTCLFVCSLHVNAASAAEPSKQTLEPLDFLKGCWAGEGWIRRRAELEEFRGTELVEAKAGNTVLAITGKHIGATTGALVHDAFAIVTRAAEGEGYRFNSFLATGQSGEYAARLEDGAFVWELTVPNRGKIQYSIRVDGDEWRETGHYSASGTPPQEIFGMTLKRVKSDAECRSLGNE